LPIRAQIFRANDWFDWFRFRLLFGNAIAGRRHFLSGWTFRIAHRDGHLTRDTLAIFWISRLPIGAQICRAKDWFNWFNWFGWFDWFGLFRYGLNIEIWNAITWGRKYLSSWTLLLAHRSIRYALARVNKFISN